MIASGSRYLACQQTLLYEPPDSVKGRKIPTLASRSILGEISLL